MTETRIKRYAVAGIVLLALMAFLRTPGLAQGGDLRYGDTVTGTLKAGLVDSWHFVGQTGDVIALNAARTSDNLEPSLTLTDSGGLPVAGTQAASGQGSVSLVQVRLPQSGSYLVKVGGNAQTAGSYRLSLTLTASAALTPSPQPTVVTGAGVGKLNYGDTVHGAITNETFRQFWRFRGTFGDVVDIRMVVSSGNLDPVVALVSPLGDTVASNDSSGGRPDALIMAFQLPFTGDYMIVARRAGTGAGQLGTTSGQYDLALASRGPGTAAQNSALNVDTPIQGRLTEQVPLAIYRLDVGGTLAVQLSLSNLHRLAHVRFMTPDGSILANFQGLNPLTFTTRLPDKGPFLVEVSSSRFENRVSTDFSLAIYRLGAQTTSAQPLQYGASRRSVSQAMDRWFFVGHGGDMVSLNVTPDQTANTAAMKMIGPHDILLQQSLIGPGVQQVITLPQTGSYEIDVQPDGEQPPLGYQINLEQIGANSIPFARFSLAADRGPLALTTTTESTLDAGGADGWWLDATAGQVINLVASPASNDAVPGLLLRAPDGSLVDAQVGGRAQASVIRQALLNQTGRYHVVVFDGTGSAGGHYRLTYEEVGGGLLASGQVVKGIASPSGGLATWTIDVTAGSLINTRLTTFTPKAWSPSLYIAEPGGAIIASATVPAAGSPEIDLLGVQAPVTGKYRLVVGGEVTDTYASYNLLSNVQVPFTVNSGSAIQVRTTQPPVGRYAPQPAAGPVQLNPGDLIAPKIDIDKALTTTLSLSSGGTGRGEIAAGAAFQAWRIDAAQDTRIMLQATALSGNSGPDLTLLDPKGAIVNEQFHADGPTTVLLHRVVLGGSYVVVARLGFKGGRYVLSFNTQNVVNGPLQVLSGLPLAYGQTTPGEILGSEDTKTYYFLGAANDVVSAQVSRITGDLTPGLELRSPHGTLVASDTNASNDGSASMPDVRLPESGIYALDVRHSAQGTKTTGRYVLYLGLNNTVRLVHQGGGVISPGQTVTGLLNTSTSQDTWLFLGHMGEQVSFIASGIGDPPPAPLSLRLQDTTGHTFMMQDVALTQSANRLMDVMLPADGIYRVQLSGAGQTTGAYSLTWQPERERLTAGPLTYNQTASGVLATTHNADTWVFSGTAGDVISVTLRFQRGDPFKGAFQLRSENGLPLVTVSDLGDGAGAHADNLLLPFSGSYTLVVANPDTGYKGAGVYTLSVNLQDSKAQSAGQRLRYGQQALGTISGNDPSDTWIFSAQTGDTVHLSVQASDQFLKPALELRTPAGLLLASALPTDTSQHAQAAIDKFTIETPGVYVVTVTGGDSKTTGAYGLALDYTPPPIAQTETINYGDTREGFIADDQPDQVRIFSGKQGDVVSARVTREPGSNLTPTLEIQTLDGQALVHADSNGADSVTIANFELPTTGQYRLVSGRYLDAQGRTVGRYKVSLSGIPASRPIKGSVVYEELAIGRLDDSNPVDRITFVGKTGDVIGITGSAKSGDLDTKLTLENSAGTILASNDDASGTDAAITGLLLPADDTYTVVLSRTGTRTAGTAGNYELYVHLLYQLKARATPQAVIAYGERVVGTVDVNNAEARYAFSGNQNDEVAIQLIHQTDDAPPLLSIQDPAGTVLAQGVLSVGQTAINRYRLPTSGVYHIVVKRPINSQLGFSPFAITLTLLTSPADQPSDGGILRPGDAITGAFQPGESAQYWLFQAKAGQAITVNLLQLNGDLRPSMLLIGPGGQEVASAAIPERGQSATIDPALLTSDGVYSLLILAGGTNHAGQYRLTLQVESNATATPALLVPGQVVNGTLDAVQPEQRWLFTGQQGQAIGAQMLVTTGSLSPRLMLVDANGQTVAEGHLERTQQGSESAIDNFVLPAPGSYTLVAGQQLDSVPSVGTYRLLLDTGLLSVQNVVAQSLVYGLPVHQFIQQGTTDTWMFNGMAGDTVNVIVVANGGTSVSAKTKIPALTVQDAAGHPLAGAEPTDAVPGEASITGLTLPEDGRYLVSLPASSTIGYMLVVQRRQNLLVEGLSARPIDPGQAQDGVITGKDIVDYRSFTGKAGSVIQIAGTRRSGDVRLDLALYAPKSGYVASATAGPDGAVVTLGPVRLPDDGTYILVTTRWLGPVGKSSGRFTLTMSTPSNVSIPGGGSIPVYNRPVTGAIIAAAPADPAKATAPTVPTAPTAGKDDTWTFQGDAGDVVNVRVTRLDGNLTPAIKLVSPDGNTVITSATAAQNQGEALISRAILPLAGRYRVIVGQSGTTSGAYKLVVERVQTAAQASIDRAEGIRYGDQKDGELSDKAPILAWVFFGKAGERVSADVKASTGSRLDPYVMLLAPDGSSLAVDDNSGGDTGARLTSIRLPSDGFYGLVVSASPLRQGDKQDKRSFGAFTISVQRDQPGATYEGRIAPGDHVDGTLTSEQPIQEWLFEAQSGLPIKLTVSSPSVTFHAALFLVGPGGHTLATSAPAKDGTVSVDTTLPGPGLYAILVSAQTGDATGRYQLSLRDATPGS